MKDPTNVQTTSRDEMICPACYTEGLEEHKAFSGDYSGKAEILKATRCPNEDCRYHTGFPQEELAPQYHDKSKLTKIMESVGGGGDGGLNYGKLIINGMLVLGVLVMAASFLGVDIMGFFGGGGGEGDIYGQVYGLDGEPAAGVTVELDNTSYNATTNESGAFVIENVSYGEYSVVASPPNDSDAGFVEQPVTVSDEGTTLANNGSVAAQMTNNNSTLALQFVSVERGTREQTISGGQQLSVSLISPRNLGEGMNVTVIPLQDTKNTGSSSVGMSESTVQVPKGTVNSAELEVVGEVTTESFDGSYTYTGSSQDVQVYGNLEPSSFAVQLEEGAGTPTFTERAEVGGGEGMTIDVSGERTVGPVSVTLSGGQSTAPNTQDGVYSGGTNPSISIDAESAPSTTTVRLTGDVEVQSASDSGTISGSTFSHDFQGNIPAQNAEISFTGGEPVDSAVDENEIQASGEGGTETEQYTLIRDADNTTYRLELDHSVDQNSGLVRAGYTVNGERTEIATGQETVDINASAGDTIVIWVEAQQEEVPESDYTHSGEFEITSSEVSETKIQPGDDVGVRATIRNPSSSRLTETIRVFRDGEQVQSQRVTLNGGEEETITFDRVSFNSEGIHTVEVSDDTPIQVEVGQASLDYGAGSIYGKLTRLGDAGEIMMDTTGDGSYDCQVSANGGSCTLGKVPSGQQSFDIRQEGVQNTGYSLSYDARNGASGISVDIDNDGTDEIDHPGVLGDGETVEERVTLDAGTHEIDFNVQNGGELPYVLEWTEAGVVDQPTVTVNGETVIDEDESFKGERTYEIDELPGGENTFRFSSASGDKYIAEITWSEQSDETIPRLLIDGQVACEKADFRGDSTCSVPTSMVDSGQVEFEFEGGAERFEYSVQQEARAVPTQVQANVNGQSVQIVQSEAVSTTSDGEWTARRGVSNAVSTGNNTVQLSTQQVNGMSVEASGTLSYTYEINQARNPQLVLNNRNGEQRFNVSDSSLNANGYLQSETQVVIPSSAFVSGDNSLTVVSDNDGGVTVQVETVNESVSSSPFESPSNTSESTDSDGNTSASNSTETDG